MQKPHKRFFETISWNGCKISDQPHITSDEAPTVDDMLDKLGLRVHKNGRLDEYRDRQHFTSDSKQRRDERKAQKYRAEEGKDHPQWRGGVEA